MTDYIHAIPGRLRIRSNQLRQCSPQLMALSKQLRLTDGIDKVRHNSKAASLTISYTPAIITDDDIQMILAQHDFGANVVEQPISSTDDSVSAKSSQVIEQVKSVAVNMLISRGLSYSLKTILGSR